MKHPDITVAVETTTGAMIGAVAQAMIDHDVNQSEIRSFRMAALSLGDDLDRVIAYCREWVNVVAAP
jgi:hypothetical protein